VAKFVTCLLGVFLVAAAPARGGRFEQLWVRNGVQLRPDDISKPLIKTAFLWTELQYYLGYCWAELSNSDVNTWGRNWWSNTLLENSSFGKHILKTGDKNYKEGLKEGLRKPPTPRFCQYTINSWEHDMQSAMADVPPK
jgi:hypothetical protein